MLIGKNDSASSFRNASRRSSNSAYRDSAIARAASSFPVPDGPVISVANSPIRAYSVRRYRRMSCVKIDCQTDARSRAAGIDPPMMFRNRCSNARWICRKQANVCRGSCPLGNRTPSIPKYCRQSDAKPL